MLKNFETVCVCPRCKTENHNIDINVIPYQCVICAYPMINSLKDIPEVRTKLTCNVYLIINKEKTINRFVVAAENEEEAIGFALKEGMVNDRELIHVMDGNSEKILTNKAIIDEKLNTPFARKRTSIKQLVMELESAPAYVCHFKETGEDEFWYWRNKDGKYTR
jgi:hypothetical protein